MAADLGEWGWAVVSDGAYETANTQLPLTAARAP